MPRSMGRAVTASDVRAAAEAGRREVAVPDRAVVTPLARDVARELGVNLRPGTPEPPGALESQVRTIVASLLGDAAATAREVPVRRVDGREVHLAPFGFPGPEPGQEVRVGDVVTAADGAPMAAGFLTLTRGHFPWTLTYDEIEYVIEGELHIGTAAGTVVGHPGDVLYVPKGTTITFGTPSWAKFLYVTYPADWSPQ